MPIKLLDCTLRDGAHVNGGYFGESRFTKILDSLSKSGIDIIEIGFLQGDESIPGRTFFPSVKEAEKAISEVSINSELCLMVRPDRYDIDQLEERVGQISRIRVAFYLEDIDLAIDAVEKIRKRGYSASFNPISITRYSDDEISAALKKIKPLNGETVSIVDTYGSLNYKRFKEIVGIFSSAIPDSNLGLHLHENLSSSFVFSQIFSERFPDCTIDGSLLGMGRSPGNLPIELICSHAIRILNQDYDLLPILDLIEEVMKPLKDEFEWGYDPHYMLSAIMNENRNEAEASLSKGVNPADFYLDLVNRSRERT